MGEMRCTRWLAGFGVLAGVVIALGLAWTVPVDGGDLAAWAQVALIVLGLGAGTLTAVAPAIVGITLPTTVRATALPLDPACCGSGAVGTSPEAGDG